MHPESLGSPDLQLLICPRKISFLTELSGNESIKLTVRSLSSHSSSMEESGLKYASQNLQPGEEDYFLLIIFSS